MRKKFIPLSLALCLTLSGCGGNVVLERSYSVSAPHSEVYWENEGADTLRADSYQDLVNALLLLLGEHSEEGVVRIYSEEDAAAMAEQACKEVQEETALGAYLLDYISYTDTQERAYYEMHVRLGYRRTAEEQAGIVTATSTEALPDLLRLTAREGSLSRIAVTVSATWYDLCRRRSTPALLSRGRSTSTPIPMTSALSRSCCGRRKKDKKRA